MMNKIYLLQVLFRNVSHIAINQKGIVEAIGCGLPYVLLAIADANNQFRERCVTNGTSHLKIHKINKIKTLKVIRLRSDD